MQKNKTLKIFRRILNIISCFSIGLGSILTPIYETLATIIAIKLKVVATSELSYNYLH
ncbi:DUF1646 family protein [Clostridium fungisolvens]|uniref:DUF1646 family protein n=1 Tax=Clostridium fungisolvens TaxID=1604897 RepID=UPI001617D79D|nr:DUF1646 family protein [Clostridium fungisolvens]